MKFASSIAPDYRRIVSAARNRKPEVMPIYEHLVSYEVIGELTNTPLLELMQDPHPDEGFRIYDDFFRRAGYDTVSCEECLTGTLGAGALMGGRGPVQSRADLDAVPWSELPGRWYDQAAPRLELMGRHLAPGMKAVGGVGNGAFEIAEHLVGLEYLPFLEADDPAAYADLFCRIGDLMAACWELLLREFGEFFCVCRFGDDLGFRNSLLTTPGTVRNQLIPQYRRVIELVHAAGKPFLLHSCGCIFEVMDDLIAAGIDAKHSNEDAIAPFARWIERYSDRIGLFGGIDMDFIVRQTPEKIRDLVLTRAPEFRAAAGGFALGTGNSIPAYVPAANYLALLEAAEELRRAELTGGAV